MKTFEQLWAELADKAEHRPDGSGTVRELDAGVHAIDVVARETGFADPERMRRAFIRKFGHPPQTFRRVAHHGPAQGPAATQE